jgi:hypothetical protein
MLPRKYILLVLLPLTLVIIAGWFYILRNRSDNPSEIVYCTLDAKMCSDGSYVGRVSPNCEFAACPEPGKDTDSWVPFTDDETGVSFLYPEKLSAIYTTVFDWPPSAQIAESPYSCTEAGSETERAGFTQEISINNRKYCVTKIVEGAAGSIYTQYAYAFAENSGTVILTFSTRSVQCGNYSEPEKSACEQEGTTFSIDSIIDRIVGSMEFE